MPDKQYAMSWRSLLEATMAETRQIRGSNYVQLSTLEGGEPRCRTIVFRGFLDLPSDHQLSSNKCDGLSTTLKMCTDMRSQKAQQYDEANSTTELVWWFPTTSEQYRIRGQLILVGGDSDDKALMSARRELWGNLRDATRESFLTSVVPGEDYQEETASIPKGGRDEDGNPLPPPDTFLLMLLDPTHVDYLRLTGEQYRQIDSKTGGTGDWTSRRVNP